MKLDTHETICMSIPSHITGCNNYSVMPLFGLHTKRSTLPLTPKTFKKFKLNLVHMLQGTIQKTIPSHIILAEIIIQKCHFFYLEKNG